MSYKLGPVIGKIGGETEIITEQADIGRGESREWSLPEGWEEGYIGAEGTPTNHGFGTPYVTIFGSDAHASGDKASGFQSLASPAVISTSSSSWSGTVTLIRTA